MGAQIAMISSVCDNEEDDDEDDGSEGGEAAVDVGDEDDDGLPEREGGGGKEEEESGTKGVLLLPSLAGVEVEKAVVDVSFIVVGSTSVERDKSAVVKLSLLPV